MRRRAIALGFSIAIHAIALVAAARIGRIASRPVVVPTALLVYLGPAAASGGRALGRDGADSAAKGVMSPGEDRNLSQQSHAVQENRVASPLPATEPRQTPIPVPKPSRSRVTTPPTVSPPRGDRASSSSARAGPVSSSGGRGGDDAPGAAGGAAGRDTAAYEQVLAAWLDTHKYYPASLRRRGIEGEGKLRIRIARSGRLIGVDVASAFPHPSLEAISQDWVTRAQPFPPVPDAIPGEEYVFIVPVGFRLR